jgi:hypothetical protein
VGGLITLPKKLANMTLTMSCGILFNSITDLVCLLLQALKLSEALISEAMPNPNSSID